MTQAHKPTKNKQKSIVGKPVTGKERLRAVKAAGRALAPKWQQYKKAVEKTRRDW